MSADQLFNPERYRFCQEFAEEIITVGESHGHQLEDLLNPSDFPHFKTAIVELSTANDPVAFTEAAVSLRKSIMEAAHALGGGVFDQLTFGITPGGIDHGLRS